MCEAFLRIKPHFSLWMKTFNVKPQEGGGQQAECEGAMVGKMPNVTWLEGAFVETIKGWHSGGSTSPSRVTLNGQRPPSSDLASHAAHLLEREGSVLG